jgi:hypothetical protein
MSLTVLEIEKALETLAAELSVTHLKVPFWQLDGTFNDDGSIKRKSEIDPVFVWKVINFDELTRKYCSNDGIACDTYQSADGIYCRETDNTVHLIEVKSFNEFWKNLQKNNNLPNKAKKKAFMDFIEGMLLGHTKASTRKANQDEIKTQHPFDGKLLDSYLILLGILGERLGRKGVAFLLENKNKPIYFVWYIPAIDPEEWILFYNSCDYLITVYKDNMCARFRSVATFAVISDEGVQLVFQ